jgi:hypothetical protein
MLLRRRFPMYRSSVVKQGVDFEPTEQVTMVRAAGGTIQPLSPPEEIEAIHAPS